MQQIAQLVTDMNLLQKCFRQNFVSDKMFLQHNNSEKQFTPARNRSNFPSFLSVMWQYLLKILPECKTTHKNYRNLSHTSEIAIMNLAQVYQIRPQHQKSVVSLWIIFLQLSVIILSYIQRSSFARNFGL